MKKVLVLVTLSVFVLSSIFALRFFKPLNENTTVSEYSLNPASINIVKDSSIDMSSSAGESVDAYYIDYEHSLDGVKNKADLIVLGRVVDQESYGEVGVKNIIKVVKSIKGKSSDTIYVLKSGSIEDEGYILKKDNEYVLLLGDQSESGKDTYFVKGGEQGCFLVKDGQLTAKDDIMKKDLEKLTKKALNKNDQLNTMIDYLSK